MANISTPTTANLWGFDHAVVKIIKNERAEYPSEWTPDVAMGINQKHK